MLLVQIYFDIVFQMKKSVSAVFTILFVIAIAIFFTTVFLYPVLQHFSTHLTSRADGIFISWTIYTVSTFLMQGKDIFQMPIYFPFKNTLTFSDPFISTAILNIPLLFFTKNSVEMQNFHLITGTIILYLSSYFLGKQLKFTNLSSHFTALFFTFSTIQMSYVVHLHTYLIAGLPLTFLFLLKWFENNKWQWLLLAICTFLYQTLNSPMNGFFIVFALVPFLFSKSKLAHIKKNWFLVCYYLLFSTIILGIVFFPYFSTSQQFGYTRTIRDTAHFAFSLERLFQIDLLLDFTLLFLLWRTRKKTLSNLKNKTNLLSVTVTPKIALVIALVGIVLMLGPVLKIHDQTFKILGIPLPLPYAVLYYIIPGFQAFRASSRWILLLNFGLTLLFGYYVNNSRLKQKFLYFFFGILLSTQLFFHFSKFELYKIPTKVPEIYEVVKTQSKKSVDSSFKKNDEVILAEFPVFSWRMMPYAYLENDRLLYQTYHGKTLYNGVSGFTPPERETQWDVLWQEFPSEKAITLLKTANVDFILVHYDLYEDMNQSNFEYNGYRSLNANEFNNRINKDKNFRLIECKENKCLYSLK